MFPPVGTNGSRREFHRALAHLHSIIVGHPGFVHAFFIGRLHDAQQVRPGHKKAIEWSAPTPATVPQTGDAR